MDEVTYAVMAALGEETENTTWLQQRSGIPLSLLIKGKRRTNSAAPKWTKDELEFLRKNLGVLSYTEIAKRLGRTRNSILLKRKRMNMPATSRHPDYITSHQAGVLLGLESHTMPGWVRSGIIDGEYAPFTDRDILRISMYELKKWLIRPQNWVYFDAQNIADQSLQRLVLLAQERWGDEWWSTRQAADYLRCEPSDILRSIKLGKISSVQTYNASGRHEDPSWSNHYVRRSEVEKLTIHTLDNYPHTYTEEAEAFCLLCYAVGLSETNTEKLMRTNQRVYSHIKIMRTEYIEKIIRKYDLKIVRSGDIMLVDWKLYRDRFPALASVMDKFAAGSELSLPDRRLVRGVLQSWASYYAAVTHNTTLEELGRKLKTANMVKTETLRDRLRSMISCGVNPLEDSPVDVSQNVYA